MMTLSGSNFGQRYYTSLRAGLFRNLIAICFLITMACGFDDDGYPLPGTTDSWIEKHDGLVGISKKSDLWDNTPERKKDLDKIEARTQTCFNDECAGCTDCWGEGFIEYEEKNEKCGTCDGTGRGCKVESFTLTTEKSGVKGQIAGAAALGMWKTSTIEVRWHRMRFYTNLAGNNHTLEKVNSWKPNEWFSITNMLEHDKENKRINFQIRGMKNRWIYYLEQDGLDFIDTVGTFGLHEDGLLPTRDELMGVPKVRPTVKPTGPCHHASGDFFNCCFCPSCKRLRNDPQDCVDDFHGNTKPKAKKQGVFSGLYSGFKTKLGALTSKLLGKRRLIEATYYSFIGFNVFLMCCLLVGISFAYSIGTHQTNYEAIQR
jgi:hypothetical protein